MITILIDGASGSGKTTLGRELAELTGFQLVHLDDFYPGWAGLAAASTMVATDVLDPVRPGFTRYDWVGQKPADRVELHPRRSLIVEGAGAVTRASKAAALRLGSVITVRLNAPEPMRRERALARDPAYAPWWDMWAEQERIHFAGDGDVEVDHDLWL
ncbi:hypothetical protein [Corynebacterium pacaense]|uniref:hypothetical protein n=1 Tax=Corynebacterium pacaense TaxID=1816684 RepID=UPI0009BAA4EB|nr:hypothetical protein [Corynebacterium pacaense]